MLKDYIVIDNILDNPDELVDLSKTIGYYSNGDKYISGMKPATYEKPRGFWRGYRSDRLHLIDNIVYQKTMNKVFEKAFMASSYTYNADAYLHIASENINNVPCMWHVDKNNILAGVIYLSKDAPLSGGTSIMINDEEHKIDNVFNRMVLYKANLIHRPNYLFGDTLENSRLTFTFFIGKFVLEYNL